MSVLEDALQKAQDLVAHLEEAVKAESATETQPEPTPETPAVPQPTPEPQI